MSKIRALVIEDSLTVRKRLIEVLSADPDIEVVGEGADGKQAIELCQRLRPDVITLDMILPVMSGFAATEYIMAYCPTPILVVSSSTNRGELFRTYEALAAGAVDVLDKPTGEEPDERWERQLIQTVKLVSRIKVITHPRGRMNQRRSSTPPGPSASAIRCVAIGASTGGPAAVLEVLRSLPSDFPIPIALVIHIGRVFAQSLAEWLDGESPIRVRQAKDGELWPLLGTSSVLIAPSDRHMTISNGRIWLTNEAERHSCRPSVDVLFDSVARNFGAAGAGCLLTGMGKDGAEGLLHIRQSGGPTIAQDEASSVIYGMPREAAEIGAASNILPLNKIARALLDLAASATK